jgi:hypothetical protein
VELGIERRIEGDDLPCGDTPAQLSVVASMDTTWQDTVWVTLDLMTDDGLVLLSGSGYGGRELLDADADGTLTTTLTRSAASSWSVSSQCDAFRTPAWELTLDWAFDPALTSDDVTLCY